MKSMYKKLLSILLLCAMALSSCSGTTQTPTTTSTTSENTENTSIQLDETNNQKTDYTFVDQADNEMTVQVPVDRMVVMQHHSLDILAQLGAQDKVVATEKNWEKILVAI